MFTPNDKTEIFAVSSAVCSVEWKYLFLRWIVGDVFQFLSGLEEKNKKSEIIFDVNVMLLNFPNMQDCQKSESWYDHWILWFFQYKSYREKDM